MIENDVLPDSDFIQEGHIPLVDADLAFRQYKSLSEFLTEKGIWHHRKFPLKYQTYFKSGGNAHFFVMPRSIVEMRVTISWLSSANIEFRVIGETSNIMFLDEVDYGVIISTCHLVQIEMQEGKVRVEAGYPLQDFVRIAILEGAAGFEGLEGIPGTVGGGIFMNAGAYGSCISDKLQSVDCMTLDGEMLQLSPIECAFSYRASAFRTNRLIIVAATFALDRGNRLAIYRKVEAVHIARHSYQEFVYPTLGSMISISGDMYRQVFRENPAYEIAYKVLKVALKNPIVKFAARKRPNNKVFNSLMKAYLAKIGCDVQINLSPKTANTIINDGLNRSDIIIKYMIDMDNVVGNAYHLENEVVIDSSFSVERSFEEVLSRLRAALG